VEVDLVSTNERGQCVERKAPPVAAQQAVEPIGLDPKPPRGRAAIACVVTRDERLDARGHL
jgi:hypothetical protein